MNYLAIGLVIIILIMLYYVYYYFTNTSLTAGLQKLNKPVQSKYELLITPNSYTYSYQCWLYIATPSVGTIFCRKSDATTLNTDFEVDINGQELLVKAGKGGENNPPKTVMSVMKNFPIQKWTYLVINVRNLQTYEAYINGKLVKTVNIPSGSGNSPVPSSNTSDLYIGDKKIDGYVTKFTRTDKTIDAKTAWENYLSGNGLSNFINLPYGLNMSISKGEEIQRVVNVF
jgi:hypothetical protein